MPKLMFHEITARWNPYVGCSHNCVYCYARELAETRLKHLPQYSDFSKPVLVEKELKRRFTKGFVFCCPMGDLWANSTPAKVIEDILQIVWNSPDATFLMLTKNPRRYFDFMHIMPPNVILGLTIETDEYPKVDTEKLVDYKVSLAPPPIDRALYMWKLKRAFPEKKTIVCIEPIMDFDLWSLAPLVMLIQPAYVYLGYDNHSHHLPEPELRKTQKLIDILSPHMEVRTKTLREKWDAETN